MQSTIEQFAKLYLQDTPREREYDVKNIAPNYEKPAPKAETCRRYVDIADYKNQNKTQNIFKPIILHAENKINYSLPSDFEEFYKLFSNGVDFINERVKFHSTLDI